MAVAIMSAHGVPVLLISVMTTRILAIDSRLRVSIWPNPRHVMRLLDPTAETRHILQAGFLLFTTRKPDELDLHRRTTIGFGGGRRVPQRAGRQVGVDVLVDRHVVDGEMRNVPG